MARRIYIPYRDPHPILYVEHGVDKIYMFVFMQVIYSDFCLADDGFTQQLLPFRPIQQTGAGREKLLIFPENHIAVGCIGDAAVLYDKRFIALPSPVI